VTFIKIPKDSGGMTCLEEVHGHYSRS